MSWGRMWRAVLTFHDDPKRDVLLQRRVQQGVATYRAGRVSDVRLAAGRLTARVQGSRATPFLVEVEVPVLPADAWDVIVDLLASRVRYSARLLAGQEPEGLIEEAASQGVHLLPTMDQLYVAAGHSGEDPFPIAAAALWEAIGVRIDAGPFPLMKLRGRGRERLLRDVSRRRRTDRDDTEPGVAVDEIALLGWSTSAAPLHAVEIPSLAPPALSAPGLRVLGDPEGWAGALSATDLLAPLVEGAAAEATRLLDEIAEREE